MQSGLQLLTLCYQINMTSSQEKEVPSVMNIYIYLRYRCQHAINVRVPLLYMVVQHRRLHEDCLQPTRLIGLY